MYCLGATITSLFWSTILRYFVPLPAEIQVCHQIKQRNVIISVNLWKFVRIEVLFISVINEEFHCWQDGSDFFFFSDVLYVEVNTLVLACDPFT